MGNLFSNILKEDVAGKTVNEITDKGLGETVAKNIESEAKKKPFLSIEDFQNRCKVSQTLIDKMRTLGLFDGMSESSQLSLFDFGV